MGFDVKARRPKKKSQTWFHCQLSWWGPLWEFVVQETGDLLPDEVAFGGYLNDGVYVKAAWAREIADRLDEALDQGRARRRVRQRRRRCFSEEAVCDFRDFCRGSSGFWIW
jgi:hypothetical protein